MSKIEKMKKLAILFAVSAYLMSKGAEANNNKAQKNLSPIRYWKLARARDMALDDIMAGT